MAVNGAVRRRVQVGPIRSPVDERGALSLLRRWRWVLLGAVVVGALAGYLYASELSPTYQAKTALLVGALSAEAEAIGSRTLTPTYASLATSSHVLDEAIRATGLDITPQELAPRVVAEGSRSTRLVTIRVRDGDRENAAALANAIAAALAAATAPPPEAAPAEPQLREFVWRGRKWREGELEEFVRRIGGQEEYTRWAVGHPEAAAALARAPQTEAEQDAEKAARRVRDAALVRAARIVEPAEVPFAPIRPSVTLAVQYSAIGALLAALGFALLGHQTESRVRTEADLARAADIPFLGAVEEPTGVNHPGSGARTGPSYHRLVATLRLGGAPPAVRSLVVVGAGTDAAAIVGNLAGAVADHGRRAALVAAGPDARIGPGRIHAPDASADEARRLLERLLGDADVVLVSAATLDQSPAALIWAPLVDGAVIVARRQRTRVQAVSDTVKALDDVRADIVGTVLRGRRA